MAAVIFMAALFAVFVALLYGVLAGTSKDDEKVIREERIMTEVTPVPEPTETVVTYPVPLDQDLQDYIVETCLEYEVSPCIVFAIIGVESNYNPSLVGDNGHSWGLMQIYNSQHIERCVRLGAWNLLDPRQNVRVGIDFFAELMNERKGVEWALMAYNAGQTRADDYVSRGILTDYANAVLCNTQQISEGIRVK